MGEAANKLLTNVRSAMGESDLFLLGADLRPGEGKSIERLEAAYNDAQGVTAEFNLNMLRALNRDAGTTFDLTAFRHRAFYNEGEGRIEMHLVAENAQEVDIPGAGVVQIGAGESIRTEFSCKYDRPRLTEIFEAASLKITSHVDGRVDTLVDTLVCTLVCTRGAAIRSTFRNWDYPIRRQIFSGFRCARDL